MKKLFTLLLAAGCMTVQAQTLDTSFNHTGYSATATWPQGNKIVQMPDGTTYEAVNNADGVTMVKFTPEGRPDSTFGPYGRSVMVVGGCVTFAPVNQVVTDIAVQPDGMVLGVGSGTYTYDACGYTNMVIFRMKANGTADSTFGMCGMLQSYQVLASYPLSLTSSHLTHIKLLPSGQFMVLGYGQGGGVTVYNLIMRFNSDGTLDPTFGVGGICTVTGVFTAVDGAWDMQVDTAGNTVIVGDSYSTDSTGYYTYSQAIRITNAGIMDSTFGTAGVTTMNFGPGSNGITALRARADDKFAITGYSGNYGTVALLNADGTIDSASVPGGFALIPLPGYATNVISSFYVQPDDNKLVVAGYGLNGYDACAYIGRININGTYDSSFNGIGLDTFNYGVYTHWQSGSFLNDIELECGNRALATGGVNNTTADANENMFIIRLQMDDTSTCTYVVTPPTGITNATGAKVTPTVYPNPAFDVVTIDNAAPGTTYRILNELGQTLLTGTLVGTRDNVDILGLTTGSYILQLTDGSSAPITRKISKL